MKRFLSILLAIILVIMQVPNVGAEGGSVAPKIGSVPTSERDITVKNAVVKDKNTILSGEEFTLTIKLENNTPYIESNVTVGIEKSSNFEVVGSGSKQNMNTDKEVTFSLKYNGGDNTQLPITIYYTLEDPNPDPTTKLTSSSATISDYINITKAQPKGEEKPEVDNSKDTPSISIVSSKTILGESGDTISIPIEIKNNSSYFAENISTTIELDGGSPLYIDGAGYSNTSRLYPGRSESLSFKVKADKMAEDKTYPIKVNFQFYNQAGTPYTASDTVYVKITDSKSSTQVVINNVDIKPPTEIQAGGVVIVGFELENKGDEPAKNLKVSLKGLANDGFSLATGLNTQTIPSLEKGKSKYIFFQLRSSKKMAAGNHDLEIVLNYKDRKNQEITDENKFFIPVASNKNQSSNLIIQNITYPTGSIGINKDVDVSFNIRNQGQSDAKDIVITAESADPAGLVPKSVSTIKLNSLAPGETQKVNYKFLTTKAAETKNYLVNIKVEYVDDLSSAEEKHSLTQFVGIFVLAPDDSDPIKTTPKLIIDKYSFEPGLVKAGENFEMSLSFFNTNAKKSVKNIKVFLTAEPNTGTDPNSQNAGSSVFTPVDSSNTFYMDSISPKGKVEKTITMFTVPDATAKTHTLTAHFEYEDGEGQEYTATELIGVPVIQQSKLETGELNYYSEGFLGEPIPVSLEFYNTGKVTLYNMMVKLEGNFQTENGSYYIGNFENGSSEYYEGMVIPNEPGLLEGEVVFTYEDSTGQEQELRKEFSLNVMDAPPMEEFPGEFPPDEGKKGIFQSKGLWITLILLLAGGGGFFFYKKKKKEKELALNE
jgi:hypothetical protein